jgi:hypothetical protein
LWTEAGHVHDLTKQIAEIGHRGRHAKRSPELVVAAKRLHRRSPKGHRRSLREIGRQLALMGFTNNSGAPYSASCIKSMVDGPAPWSAAATPGAKWASSRAPMSAARPGPISKKASKGRELGPKQSSWVVKIGACQEDFSSLLTASTEWPTFLTASERRSFDTLNLSAQYWTS